MTSIEFEFKDQLNLSIFINIDLKKKEEMKVYK